MKSPVFAENREVLVVESVDRGQELVTLADMDRTLVIEHCPKEDWDGLVSSAISVSEQSEEGDA